MLAIKAQGDYRYKSTHSSYQYYLVLSGQFHSSAILAQGTHQGHIIEGKSVGPKAGLDT